MATKQTEANKRWIEKNKEKAKYNNSRTRARTFLSTMVTIEDLAEFKEIIENRELELNRGN